MFISCEWTKEENLCVDTLNHFPGCHREGIQIFFYFFSLFYFYQVNQIMVKAFQVKD